MSSSVLVHTDITAVLAAGFAVLQVILAGVLPPSAAVGLALLLSGCAVTLSACRRIGLFQLTLVLSAALMIAAALHVTDDQQSRYLYLLAGTQGDWDDSAENMPHLPEFDVITGRLRKDAVMVSSEMQIAVLSVDTVTDSHKGITCSADVPVTVMSFGSERLFWGEEVRVSGRFSFDRGDPVFLGGSIVRTSAEPSLRSRITAIRTQAVYYCFRRFSILGTQEGELAAALLLGRSEDRRNPIILRFRQAGCSHLLALSGMHLHLLSAVLGLIASRILPARSTKAAVTAVVLLFVLTAGLKPSLVRAYLLQLVILFYRRRYDPHLLLHTLTIVLPLQTLLFPEDAGTAGFILSYSALYSIGLFSGRFEHILPGIIPPGIRSGLSASLAASFGSASLLILFFGEFSPAGPAASLVLTPLIMGYMSLGLILLIPGFSAVSAAAAEVMEVIFRLLESTSGFFGKVPLLVISPEMKVQAAAAAGGAAIAVLTGFIAFEYAVMKGRAEPTILMRAVKPGCRAAAAQVMNTETQGGQQQLSGFL
jgi:ComEC/Rec2-related protein